MYAEALHENERLKSRLQDSKQELVKIRSQLEKVTQVECRKTTWWNHHRAASSAFICGVEGRSRLKSCDVFLSEHSHL